MPSDSIKITLRLIYSVLSELAEFYGLDCKVSDIHHGGVAEFSIIDDPECNPLLIIEYHPNSNTFCIGKFFEYELNKIDEISAAHPGSIRQIDEYISGVSKAKDDFERDQEIS